MGLRGRWRIIEMEVWDRKAIDLLGPAFIELTSNGQGSFRFTVGAAILTGIKRQVETGGHVTWLERHGPSHGNYT